MNWTSVVIACSGGGAREEAGVHAAAARGGPRCSAPKVRELIFFC
ncbi:hypothetical protein ES332_D13G169500v1 [Gossypium tomentosum]|uniref:Uncharacterized protein n=1 Tax=Gossypium tomentosum TaxID=34277 RepID=A0A5D2HY58_GOSTO|nr:hypothetical protein ES332_D13G169500v1 [Gossypium tomentosum]